MRLGTVVYTINYLYTINYEEARACHCANAMQLVPVRMLTDALTFLRHLQ